VKNIRRAAPGSYLIIFEPTMKSNRKELCWEHILIVGFRMTSIRHYVGFSSAARSTGEGTEGPEGTTHMQKEFFVPAQLSRNHTKNLENVLTSP